MLDNDSAPSLSHRQKQIVQLIQQSDYCSIEHLAQQFDVTPQTIRRDINSLCDFGLARRHHGGVGAPATLSNQSYRLRQETHREEKLAIAQQVTPLIPNGSTIFLGIGSTIALIAETLYNHTELRVVTNNFEAAHILSQYSHIETWVPGGMIRPKDQDIVGESISQFFGQFYADIGIIGCASITTITNPTNNQTEEFAMEHEPREAIVSQAILNNAHQKWLVASNEKWQRHTNAKVTALNTFHRIFKSGKS
ncbi:DeoR family transcriptional regulator [Vibrio sp. CAIM 722]|uniref:DeoR family transcriptional regulator n=1 Tax=Vibrio eleionomae TaxID=2653505 RepID=A0A7X4LNA0_9VIBR|nr:DeoR/GlpR family DNA-binding transcription regulator [Vibrio eleionomae]MZI95044.1 DeoR family transcriptional regulator [Vibrio eleionomae]